MIRKFKKIISYIRTKGLFSTVKAIQDKLAFIFKIHFTELKLGLIKSFVKSDLVVKHGKYKFTYSGGGDRGEILYHACWNKLFFEELDKIKNYIKPGDTVIDVGGNLGFFVLILNELVGESGKIYSFEPSKKLKERLESTISNNNLKNVTVVNLALGETEGSTTLHFNPKQTGLSSIVSDFDGGSLSEEIQITTLDKFSKAINERISFIKIDTEGYEPQVLKGAKELISRHKPIIYIELGGDHQESSEEALQILKELDYYCEAENVDLTTTPAGVNFIALSNK